MYNIQQFSFKLSSFLLLANQGGLLFKQQERLCHVINVVYTTFPSTKGLSFTKFVYPLSFKPYFKVFFNVGNHSNSANKSDF